MWLMALVLLDIFSDSKKRLVKIPMALQIPTKNISFKDLKKEAFKDFWICPTNSFQIPMAFFLEKESQLRYLWPRLTQ